jgi:glycosyltransferase involved in cell wall biosynthesis
MRSRRLRLLFLLPFSPRRDARHGGKATAELVTRLAERHHAALVCLRAPDEDPPEPDLVDRLARLELIPAPGRDWRRPLRLAGSLARGLPIEVADSWSADAARRIRELVRTWQPELVHAEMERMAPYLRALESSAAARMLVAHEPASHSALERFLVARGARRALRYLDLRAWRRLEQAFLPRLHALVVYTGRDRCILSEVAPGVPIETIPLRVGIPRRPLHPAGSPEEASLVFVGGFGHPPNVDAALRLARDIFPRVRARVPGARLYLVGDKPPRPIRRLAAPDVVVTGSVADVTPYLDRASVVVAPLRLGGGSRIKVLEALAAGKAVVASSRAAEGLGAADQAQLIIADGDEELAEAAARLLLDPRARVALAQRARAWAEKATDWEAIVAAYESLYHRLLDR